MQTQFETAKQSAARHYIVTELRFAVEAISRAAIISRDSRLDFERDLVRLLEFSDATLHLIEDTDTRPVLGAPRYAPGSGAAKETEQ
jgi:hypothetical protein